MGKAGRPKLIDSEKRGAGALLIRLNKQELEIVSRKASEAGLTPTEWARFAALERTPPPRQIIPALNSTAWLELSKLAATLNGLIWRLGPGGENSLKVCVEQLRGELGAFRNLLIGGGQ